MQPPAVTSTGSRTATAPGRFLEAPVHDDLPPRTRLLAALVAAVLAVAAQLAGMAMASVFPFGRRPWAVNDAYNQLLPQKAYLRELLLHPQGPDSLLLNWHSALGTPYLGDFATYAASPFNLLLVLVPEDRLTVGVQLITGLQIATAAAAMALVLFSLHRRASWGIAAALGAGYASCGWVAGDAMVVLSWLDGLIAFPVLLWAALRLVRRRSIVVPVLLVALFWTANYYTAVMATLGVGLVLLALLVIDGVGPSAALGALARVVGGFALGIAMTGWLVLPVLAAVAAAAPVPGAALYQMPWDITVARLFPGNWTLGSAGIFAGLGTLVLVAAAPWRRALGVRARIALVVLPVAAMVSMQVPATQLAWHSFAAPNGSGYREAFVIAGILVVTAWLALATGLPGRRPLLAGAATVAVLGALVVGRLSPLTLAVSAASLALLAATAALGRRRLIVLALLVTVLVESAYTAGATYRDKAKHHGAPTTLSAAALAARRAEVPVVPAGERTRVTRSSDNDPLLLGYNGVDYYSSTLPRATAEALSGLGLPYWRRRIGLSAGDPAALALLGIHSTAGDRVNRPVTVLPPGPVASDPAAQGTVWAVRDDLAGTRLYTVPPLRISATDPTATDPTAVEVTARCAPGSTLQLLTGTEQRPSRGTVDWQGRTADWDVPTVLSLGTVPADGQVDLIVRSDRPDIRPGDLGCLDPTALDRTVAASQDQAPTVRFGRSSVTAQWVTPQTGEAVVLTTALPGWSCRTDAGPATVTSRAGMLTVPVHDTTRLTCDHRQPGLAPGLGISAAALAATIGLELIRLRRRRQDRRRPGRSAHRS
ncbi:YfhO family protein [Raineyella sp.]|uniref:YfhO family protein n=1 Tax=Raineyella sp. TaxID=1911550 RepID=UPI002B208700|nr:YfhO family protein [Raineyella sp.]MEA5153641.1 YfhO family protein [Raineyella sp.]